MALLVGSRDEFRDRKALEAFVTWLPRETWLRLLDTDHFFAGKLEELAAACREIIAWSEGMKPS